jgi:ketosteroid isomerase-like protein
MSQENVEIVQAAFAAWNRGDMDALRELYHPDVIMLVTDNWPEPGPFVGRDAVMHQHERFREPYDSDWFEPITSARHIADRVVVKAIWHGVGQGPETKLEWTVVYGVRSGTIRFLELFWDHAEALEAVGLSE